MSPASYYVRLNLAKVRLVVAFFCGQSLFKSFNWFSIIKISPDGFKFSRGDSEKYFGFSTLLRSSGKSIMPGIVEISSGTDARGKSLKTKTQNSLIIF